VRDLFLADDGLVDAAQVDVPVYAVDIQVHVNGDIAIVMHARQQFHVHAGVDVLELRIHQRVDAHAADAGWKLPLAVGTRSPILSVAFTPSTERTCGACSTFARASLITACNRAPGRVVEKSELARCPRLESGMELPYWSSWWLWG